MKYFVNWVWNRLAPRRGGALLATLIITGLLGFLGGFRDRPAMENNHWIPAYGALGGMAMGLFGFAFLAAREALLFRVAENRRQGSPVTRATCLLWALYLIAFPIGLLVLIVLAVEFIN